VSDDDDNDLGTTDDPSYWLDYFVGDTRLAALVVGGLTRRRCPWCERELRPCNMGRHIAARHHRQMTIYDVLPPDASRVDMTLTTEALQ
jgi:hypothetical protein